MSVNFLIKLRDAHQMIADAYNEEIELYKPAEAIEITAYNPENLAWNTAQGSKGPFQAYPKRGEQPNKTSDYTNLLADIKQHKGKLSRAGLFYWLFENGTTIGRKETKKQ